MELWSRRRGLCIFSHCHLSTSSTLLFYESYVSLYFFFLQLCYTEPAFSTINFMHENFVGLCQNMHLVVFINHFFKAIRRIIKEIHKSGLQIKENFRAKPQNGKEGDCGSNTNIIAVLLYAQTIMSTQTQIN